MGAKKSMLRASSESLAGVGFLPRTTSWTTNSTTTVKAKTSRPQAVHNSNGSFQNHPGSFQKQHIYKSQRPTLCVLLFA